MKLLQRTFRITPKQDAKIKKKAEKTGKGEAEIIRELINKYV